MNHITVQESLDFFSKKNDKSIVSFNDRDILGCVDCSSDQSTAIQKVDNRDAIKKEQESLVN